MKYISKTINQLFSIQHFVLNFLDFRKSKSLGRVRNRRKHCTSKFAIK